MTILAVLARKGRVRINVDGRTAEEGGWGRRINVEGRTAEEWVVGGGGGGDF